MTCVEVFLPPTTHPCPRQANHQSSREHSYLPARLPLHTPHTMIDLPTVFSDITPVPQNEGAEPPVCSIAYAPEFIEAYDYLRALLRIDERSKRALDLTTLCLKLNPANYTVWHYRRRILIELGGGDIDDAAIEKDLDLADDLGGTNPKNYQLWYHRRALLEIRFKNADDLAGLEAAKKELGYVDRILEDDSKNYHVSLHLLHQANFVSSI